MSTKTTPTGLVGALDIGGTKLAAGLVDSDGRVVAEQRRSTRATSTTEGLFSDTCELLDSVLKTADVPVIGLGIGSPGPMTSTTVSPVNIPVWRDFPLRERILGHFGDRIGGYVALDNDVKVMALGEGWLGAARGVGNYIAMVVSTGIGGGIVLDGRLLDGRQGNAGHIGHMVVVPGGMQCGCGNRGCLEAEASGTAIAREAAAVCRSGVAGDGPLKQMWDERRRTVVEGESVSAVEGFTAEDVAIAARDGDYAALRILERAGRIVGRAIAGVATLLDLDVAVLGGGVVQVGDALLGPMQEEATWSARLGFAKTIEVRPAQLGTESGLVGAAASVLTHVLGERPGQRGDVVEA